MNENELEKTQEEQESKTTPDTEWEDNFRKQFDELKLKPPKNSMKNAERELIIWYFRNLLTSRDTYWKEKVGEIRLLIAKYAKAEDMDVAGLVNEINTLCK